MIALTNYSVDELTLNLAQSNLPKIGPGDKKASISLNQPTESFFYDPWKIKDKFRGTVWETILDSIPAPIGEARIICLEDGSCYMSHSDIDDRYHLGLSGQYSFLIDLDSQKMYPTLADGKWYTLNGGVRHVAANFGSFDRFQLVVRNLLNRIKLKDPVYVKIVPICSRPRFEFDDTISPWLNKMNKLLLISDFKLIKEGVSFRLEKEYLKELDLFPKEKFEVTIEK